MSEREVIEKLEFYLDTADYTTDDIEEMFQLYMSNVFGVLLKKNTITDLLMYVW